MNSLLILGAGGHGKVIADTASLMDLWDDIAFLDDRIDLKSVLSFPVIGRFTDANQLKGKFKYAFAAIGNNTARLELLNSLLGAGFELPVIIHPKSTVSRFSRIGAGSVVMAGAVINANTFIGKGCILNTCCSIDHDCVLEDGVHISPDAHTGGTVKIGRCSWVCIGSSIINNINIGRNSVIAAGAAVLSNVPDNVMVAGVPAIIKKAYP